MQTCTRNTKLHFHEIEPKMCFLTGPWMLVAPHQGSALPSAPQGGDGAGSSSSAPSSPQKAAEMGSWGTPEPTKLCIAPPELKTLLYHSTHKPDLTWGGSNHCPAAPLSPLRDGQELSIESAAQGSSRS